MKLLLYTGIESADLCYTYSKISVVWREFIFGIHTFNGGSSLCLKKNHVAYHMVDLKKYIILKNPQ